MISKHKTLGNGLLNFHRDEDGMEAIQTVALVAIGALVLIFVKTTLWPKVQTFARDQVENLTK